MGCDLCDALGIGASRAPLRIRVQQNQRRSASHIDRPSSQKKRGKDSRSCHRDFPINSFVTSYNLLTYPPRFGRGAESGAAALSL